MSKFLVFSLRDDEVKAEELFRAEHPEIEYVVRRDILTKANMDVVTADYDGVIVQQIQAMEEEVYEHLANMGIKVFATRSAGVDMYRTDLLKKYNIRLTNVPSYSPESISEYAFTSAMYFARNMHKIQKNVRERDFRWQPSIISTRIQDKVVGIVGTGFIGRETARFFKSVGAKVLGYDLYPNESIAGSLLEYVDLETLIKESDIISLHMPATKDNHHLFNAEMFAKMKKGAILVNTARGAIVDTPALLESLKAGHLGGAALDTYEFEAPYVPKDNRGKEISDAVLSELLERDDILYSPHVAFYTESAVKALFDGAILAADDIVEKGESKFEVKL